MQNNNLIKLVLKNKLSIRDNPNGLKKLWPNSYIQKFYNIEFYNFLRRKEVKNLLDVNSINRNQRKLWKEMFPNALIKNCNFPELNNLNLNNIDKFNIIVINKIKHIKNRNIQSYLLSILDKNGIIIVEDSGQNLFTVINLFINLSIKYYISIEDFRMHRILRNNCLLIIKKNKKTNFINYLKLLFHIFIEITIKLFDNYLSNIFKKVFI